MQGITDNSFAIHSNIGAVVIEPVSHGGRAATVVEAHRQQAMDRLTLNQAALNNHRVVEEGGLRSSWSPHHEFQNDIPFRKSSLSEFSKRVSKRFTSSMLSISELAWEKLRPVKRKHVGWGQSFKALVQASFLNWLLVFVPASWILGILKSHSVSHLLNFSFSFLAIMPLCKLLEFGGENLALYCGKEFGDLIIITSTNAIEAILAICLLWQCQLKLLQSSIIGVVILRLLFVSGVSFIIGGSRVAAQELHPHVIQLNQSLLFTSVLFLILPVSFFAALDRGTNIGTGGVDDIVTDHMRDKLLEVSRGLAMMLLIVYVCSRWFLHNPINHEHLHEQEDAPEELKKVVAQMAEEEPEMNIWVCIITLVCSVGLLAVTAQFLLESIEPIKNGTQYIHISEEFFGLVMLPLCSFSGDALVTFVYFIRSFFFNSKTAEPPALANYRAIESSIQFILLWTPFIITLAWCLNKPLSLLFDFYEVAVLLGACFLVNYVTADAKTNWAEGALLVALYFMITLTTWFYPGQPEVWVMLQCSSVSEQLAAPANPNPMLLAQPPTVNNIRRREVETLLADDVISEKLRRLIELYDVLVDDREL